MAAAQQLNRAGHTVTVYERDEKPGGLLRYGIPDFKMEKHVIDRRLEIMKEEGVSFKCGVHVGKDIKADVLKEGHDAVVLTGGATIKRKLPIEGSELKGVVQAMDFLPQNNRRVDGISDLGEKISAKDKDVIVIGGGDTGSTASELLYAKEQKVLLILKLCRWEPPSDLKGNLGLFGP